VITILVVGGAEAAIVPPDPAIEVLRASDASHAVERLARNRRIDAILLLDGSGSVLSEIAAEELSPPPVYAPAGSLLPEGARALDGRSVSELLQEIAADLGD
jgi:hypothetical protein